MPVAGSLVRLGAWHAIGRDIADAFRCFDRRADGGNLLPSLNRDVISMSLARITLRARGAGSRIVR
jgi:hypothetical protein